VLYSSEGQQHPSTRQTNFPTGKHSIFSVSSEMHRITG